MSEDQEKKNLSPTEQTPPRPSPKGPREEKSPGNIRLHERDHPDYEPQIGVDYDTSGFIEAGPERQYDAPEDTTAIEPTQVEKAVKHEEEIQQQKEELYSERTYKDSRCYKQSPELASDIIRNRLFDRKISFLANDTIYQHIEEGELASLQNEVQVKCEELLDLLLIDRERDHNTKDTGKRMAKMFLHEVMKGRYHPPPKVTTFPNTKKLDEIYTLGPIKIRSMCSHHFVPIVGECWIGVIPTDKVMGLSKFNRLIDWAMSRPQIQEEAIIQIADGLEEVIKPMGLAIVMKAEHMCMCWRGVKEDTTMTTSVMRGIFGKNPYAKQEFFALIKGQGYV